MVSMAVSAGSSLLRRKTGCVGGLVMSFDVFVVSSVFVEPPGISIASSDVFATSFVLFIASEKRGHERLFGEGEMERGGAGRFDGVGKGD